MKKNRPNILIFMTDHQRGDTVLPEHPAITPNLTKMANEGVIFTNAYCPSPHCCPSRATFFSGLYPTLSGVYNNVCNDQALTRGLKPEVRLWSEELANLGYEMLWIGKWHVSVEESPKDRGWTEVFLSCSKRESNKTLWDEYRKFAKEESNKKIRGKGQILRPGYGTYKLYGERSNKDIRYSHDEVVISKAIKSLSSLRNKNKPWVLFLGLGGPHDPYLVPSKFIDMYNIDDVPLPHSFKDNLEDKPRIYQRMRKQIWGQLSEYEVRDGIRHFWAYCSYLDHLFGKILKTLEDTKQVDNTLVLYCSDHGDYCGDHGLFAKGIPCFRGAYHIPVIIRWPNGIKNPNRRIEKFVSLADFAPTFIELAGAKVKYNFSGCSIVPFLDDQNPVNWRDEIHTQCNGVELYYTQRSVMTDKYKYVFNGFDFDELYDLKNDPHEMRNIINNPDYELVKRELVRRMWRFAYRNNDTIISKYITVGLAPYGPSEAFKV